MNFKKITLTGTLFMLLLMLSSCYYDVEEEIYPKTDCNTDNITYSMDIVAILQSNCYVCHSQAANQGGITLEGFNNLKTYVDNGRFLGAVKHEAGYSPMPQGAPQLPDCQIAQIEQWILDGALNN
jgi:hypothetical protein